MIPITINSILDQREYYNKASLGRCFVFVFKGDEYETGQLNYCHHCKELAVKNAFPDNIYFKLAVNDNVTEWIKNFKILDGLLGLDTKVDVINHHVGPILNLENSWYNTNFVTKELGLIFLYNANKACKSLINFGNDLKYKFSYQFSDYYLDRYKKFWNDPAGHVKRGMENGFDFDKFAKQIKVNHARGLFWSLSIGSLDSLIDFKVPSSIV